LAPDQRRRPAGDRLAARHDPVTRCIAGPLAAGGGTEPMISRFFIDNPVFANVIAIVTLIIGGVALYRLPVEQYPQITPPTVQGRTAYPRPHAPVRRRPA